MNREDLIKEATKIYGEKYHKVIEKAFKERWIDYASYKGKRRHFLACRFI